MNTTTGIVRLWLGDEGWGVIDSAATPGGCWAHFSSLRLPGYRELTPGDTVTFVFEEASQDGYAYRAVTVGTGPAPEEAGGTKAAYRSTLHLEFD